MTVIRIWLDNLAADGSGLLDRLLKPLLQRFSLTAASAAAGIGNELANCSSPAVRQRLLDAARRELLPAELPHDCKLENVIHRIKERGTLLEFRVPANVSPELARKDLVKAVRQHFQHSPSGIMADTGFWSSLFAATRRQFRPFLVKGEPFLDDIITRTPSNRLRIDFLGSSAEPVPLERMYAELRPFGRLIDLSYTAQPTGKDVPRSLMANYLSMTAASGARVCLNGYQPVAGGPRLFINYEKILRTNTIFKWLADHPRISVPIGAGTLLGISYAVFDPVRVYFISTVLSGRYFTLPQCLHLPWLSGASVDLWRTGREGFSNIWSYSIGRLGVGGIGTDSDGDGWFAAKSDEEDRAMTLSDIGGRAEVRQRLENWLKEPPTNFMLIAGPHGYGKTELVRAAVDQQKYSLWIHCDEIIGHSNTEIISRLADQVGYFPLFGFLSSLSSLFDAALSATTGQKTLQFATSEEGQIRKILELTAVAMNKIVSQQKQSFHYQSVAASASVNGSAVADKKVTPPPVLLATQTAADASSQSAAIDYPTVVISGFMTADHHHPAAGQSSTSLHQKFHEELIEWAAFLVQNGIARVVFVTSTGQKNGGSSSRINRALSKVLPLRPLDMVVFSDARPEESMRYLQNQIGSAAADRTIPKVLESLGGRLADLEAFVTKVKAGMTPEEALDDLLVKAMIEIRKYGFGEEIAVDSEKAMPWTPSQFWYVLKQLSVETEVEYCKILFSPLFKGDNKALQGMERADLIAITYIDGQPTLIRPSKSLYQAAFRRITADPNTAATFEIIQTKTLWELEEQKIKDYERELRELKEALDVRSDAWKSTGGWFSAGGSSEHPLIARYRFICTLLEQSQKKAEQFAKEKSRLESFRKE